MANKKYDNLIARWEHIKKNVKNAPDLEIDFARPGAKTWLKKVEAEFENQLYLKKVEIRSKLMEEFNKNYLEAKEKGEKIFVVAGVHYEIQDDGKIRMAAVNMGPKDDDQTGEGVIE